MMLKSNGNGETSSDGRKSSFSQFIDAEYLFGMRRTEKREVDGIIIFEMANIGVS